METCKGVGNLNSYPNQVEWLLLECRNEASCVDVN
jgi:hypothetical protein